MCSRRAFTHPTSEKLIAGLKLAIAVFNPDHVEGDRGDCRYFRGDLSLQEGEFVAGLWVERESLALSVPPARRGV